VVVQSVADGGKQLARLGGYKSGAWASPPRKLCSRLRRADSKVIAESGSISPCLSGYLFFQLAGLADAAGGAKGDQSIPLFVEGAGSSPRTKVDGSCFELFCAPVSTCSPKFWTASLSLEGFYEFHVVPDRNRTTDSKSSSWSQ